MPDTLQGLSVLITRPAAHAVSLCERVEFAGGIAIHAPMLEIRSVSNPSNTSKIDQLERYEKIIFISRNAVNYGLAELAINQRGLTSQQLFAVGPGTAKSLQESGFGPVSIPVDEFSSAGLLRLGALQKSELVGAKILIFRGLGGRELLSETLQLRGAEVDYCEVYERAEPQFSLTETLVSAQASTPTIAVVTSLDSLNNLAKKIRAEALIELFDMPLVVVGARIARGVAALGFTNPPVIVDNPDDDTIIDTLTRWAMDEL
ncbi:MAG: uroporphyrinogen-III synthase [Gammaproteobacteria bacterium]|jgi:uroporphyrinogen-III synthase